MVRWRKLGVALALGVLAGTVLLGPFGSTRVCTKCARVRHTTELQLPLIPISYLWWHRDETNPLAQLLEQRGLLRDHSHQWLFCTGAGNGVMCALGSGRRLLTAANSPVVAAFVRNLIDFSSPHETDSWLDLLLGGRSESVTESLRASLPAPGFDRREDLEAWLRTSGKELKDSYSPTPAP